MKNIKLLAATAVLFSGALSQAALTPLGGEYPLVGDTAGHQQNPHVAVGPSGGFVVWQNATADSQGERILAQRLNADFQGVGGAIVISQNLARNNEINPRVALLPNGAALFTWESGPRSSRDIYYRVIDGAGNTSTAIQRVNTFVTGIQSDPAVAALPDGQVLVVWTSLGQDGDGQGIFAQRFTASGGRVGAEFGVNQTTARNQSKPSVAALAGERFVVGWIGETINGRNTSGALNLRANVMARIFTATGPALGNEYRLNDGDVVSSEVQLAPGLEGGFVAAWVQQDEANMNNLSDVYVKKFDANGLPVNKAARHNTFLKGRQENPELAIVGQDALVSWTSHGQDAGGAGIQGRLISGGTEFEVNSQGNLHQRNPTAGSNGANKYFVVWVNTIRADHSILSAQRYLASNGVALEHVVDVTQGAVQVVGAAPERRRTNLAATAPRQAAAVTAPQPVATLNIAPPPPRVASVAPTPIQTQAPVAVSAPSLPEPATPTARPAQSTARAAATANRSMTQLQNRANQRNVRLNLRTPGFANTAAAAQSTLMQQARARIYGNQPGYQPRSTAFNRTQPNSISRGAFLRPTLSGTAMNRANYARSNLRTPTRPSFTTPSSTRTAGSSRLASNPVNNRVTQLGSYSRQNTRRPATAADRFGSMRDQAQANAALARNSGQRPVPASITRNGRGTQLQWIARTGGRYQVQSSNDKNNWQNVGTPRSTRLGTDAIAMQSGGPRYFRVVRTN